MRAALAVLVAVTGFGVSAQADTLVLRNGTRYDGTFVSGDRTSIRFDTGNSAQRRFYLRDIQTLQFGTGTAAYNDSYSNPRGTVPGRRMLPAGTELSVRTNETIHSDSATEGRTYSAIVDREVADSSGTVVIPRGANAELVIRDMSGGGRLGSPELVLGLQSVTIGGRNYLVETADVERSSDRGIGTNRRTATMVGGGAALGTLLGAIAGGGKGAVIGAIAGAAAGGTAQVLTKGDRIEVPAESQLTFRLDEAITLQPR
jgi:hypothetical protein